MNAVFKSQEIAFPKMVASCCRFLCYFCRISRQNQKAMFDHLSYLLENSSVGLGNQTHTHIHSVLQECRSGRAESQGDVLTVNNSSCSQELLTLQESLSITAH